MQDECLTQPTLPGSASRILWVEVILLALLVTILNALKPLHIDDTCYY